MRTGSRSMILKASASLSVGVLVALASGCGGGSASNDGTVFEAAPLSAAPQTPPGTATNAPAAAQPVAATGPTIDLTPLNGSTYSKAALGPTGAVSVLAVYKSAAGFGSVSLSGGSTAATGNFPGGTKEASAGTSFFGYYFPAGTYTFRAQFVDADGVSAEATTTIHLID